MTIVLTDEDEDEKGHSAERSSTGSDTGRGSGWTLLRGVSWGVSVDNMSTAQTWLREGLKGWCPIHGTGDSVYLLFSTVEYITHVNQWRSRWSKRRECALQGPNTACLFISDSHKLYYVQVKAGGDVRGRRAVRVDMWNEKEGGGERGAGVRKGLILVSR